MTRKPGANTEAIAKYLDLSSKRIRQLVQEKVLSRRSDDTFDRDACRVAYIRYLRDEGRRVTKSAAASRAQEARADEIELRVAKERGKLIESDEVDLVTADILGALCSELSGVSAACTRDLEMRRIIEVQINAAIEHCRKRFEEASQALRGGREVFVDSEETTAG